MTEWKFKNTEVGRIPEDWEVKAIGDITKKISSGKNKEKGNKGKYLVYGSTGVIGRTNIPIYKHKQLLVARVGVNAGYVHIAEGEYDVSDNTLIVDVNDEYIFGYMYYIFVILGLNKYARGGGQPLITSKQIKELLIPLPPLAEQERIAGALSAVDGLIEALDARIEKTRNIKQGTMQHLLNPLYNNPALLRPLGEEYRRIKGTPITANIMQRIANPSGNIIIYAGGKTIVKAYEKDIPNANIITIPAVLIQSRGIVDAIYCDEPFTFKNEMWAYTCDNVASLKYLCYYLKFDIEYFRTAAERSGMPQISIKDTEEYLIPLPSLAEQERIANILTTLDDELAALEARRAKYAAVKSGMLQVLLTGTIRLSKSASECK